MNTKSVLIVDSEAKTIEQIKKALLSIDAQIKITAYTSFAEMEKSYKGLNPLQQLEFYKFNILVLDYALLKPTEWEAQLKALRAKNKISSSLCFSAYDNATINRKLIYGLQVFNILYKPFDPLILIESLNIALKAKENIKPKEIKAQSTEATITMFKEVEPTAISELGFITLADKPVALDSVCKYHSILFKNEKKQSVWAQCLASAKAPNKPGFFINKFQFVALETPTLMNIRRYIQLNKQKNLGDSPFVLGLTKARTSISIALISNRPNEKMDSLKQDILTHFKNVKVDILIFNATNIEFGNQQPSSYSCVINFSTELKYETFKSKFSTVRFSFFMASTALDDEKIKNLQPIYNDIFLSPFDRSYFYKKLKLFMPDLQAAEKNDLMSVSTTEKIKEAQAVKISEICEVYINFSYPLELPNGTARDFAFLNDDETKLVEIPGVCNYTEKKDNGFFHQFILWGVTDLYLKQIRIWLLQNHIEQNKSK